MTYLAEKNARRHRRNAKFLTALITLSLLVAFAYYGGLLDGVLDTWLDSPADAPAVATTA